MLTVRTTSPEQTRAIGTAVATLVGAGDVLALSGDLGAGKTCLVQGLARGLGIVDRVTSPTFSLVRTYPAQVPLVHVDVYRLDTLSQVQDLGDEVLADDHITCIEWGDAIAPLLPTDRMDVDIALLTDDDERCIRLTLHGDWAQRANNLADALVAEGLRPDDAAC